MGDHECMRWIAIAALCVLPVYAAELKPATLQAFDEYVRQTEERLNASKVLPVGG